MKYSSQQLKQDTQSIIDEIFDLQDEKGNDYANKEDTLANYRKLKYPYACKRLYEKTERLFNLTDEKLLHEIESDKVIAELRDILNIAILSLILAEYKPKQANPIESLKYNPEKKE